VSRVADSFRRDTLAADLALTPGERVEQALRLGDCDAELYAAAHGVEPEVARGVHRRQRASGRRPSRCASGP